MTTMNHTLLLVSRNDDICAAFRKEFELEGGGVDVLLAAAPDDARRLVKDTDPSVIVLEESGLSPARENAERTAQGFEADVALLAGIAPVVVLASPERQSEIAALLAAGAVEFVARAGDFFPCLIGMVERRLQRKEEEFAMAFPGLESRAGGLDEDFGEVLRHELNNPLTGILGNAELLLADVRRQRDGRLPENARERLQTITDLAVRLRETVRRLSEKWMEKHANARSA
jgi:signal transduction histidine kinase